MEIHPTLTIHDYAEDSYLDYALATIKERAMPESRDGQKPVQRRILYGMHLLGLAGNAKPVKAARVVGDVLGKFHPHGDIAAYDAMVRMAQDFTLRYPLVIGEGNYGSRDGDMAAAMRYTEAKLSPISELLLSELGLGTVDYVDNYDGTLQEPRYLPARLPFSLLNGSKGVAVGMANDILPHNLREVAAAAAATIKNPNITVAEVLSLIPGPDFPDGAQVISSKKDIEAAYSTGRGSLRCRAVWVREELARSQWQIVITELPYQVSTKKILEEIEVLTNPQVKGGKKTLDPQQVALKQLALDFLDTVRDESGREAPVRLVIEPRNSKVNEERLMTFLLANTSLEGSLTVNMTAIGLDGKPQTKGIDELLKEWAQFRVDTVNRRTQHELEGVSKRAHVLEGRLLAFMNLEDVVKIVRDSENPAKDLGEYLGLSDIQAEDILDMRLRQLNRLEGDKIENELKSLNKRSTQLIALLNSDSKTRALIVKEIEADCSKFGDDRRTLIQEATRAQEVAGSSVSIADEPVTLVLTKNLWIKAYRGHGVAPEQFNLKSGDSVFAVVETRTVEAVVVMDTLGRVYNIDAADIPSGRGDGIPLTTLIELHQGAKVHAMIGGNPEQRYLISSSNGNGFITTIKGMTTRIKAGKTFLRLNATDLPLPPVALPESDEEGYLACGTSDGRILVVELGELRTLAGGGAGTILMNLDGETVSGVQYSPKSERVRKTLRVSSSKGELKEVTVSADFWEKALGKRARKGVKLPAGNKLDF